MGFTLIPKSVTLNEPVGVIAVILHYITKIGIFGCSYAAVVEVGLCCLRQQCSPKNLVFNSIGVMLIFSEILEKQCPKDMYHPLKLHHNLETV